jgi:hypothetical protein
MFLPPVAPGVEWLNDPEGTQPRANVSFESIGAWYRTMANAGFIDLSYANVNEYGINVIVPPPSSTVTLSKALPIINTTFLNHLFEKVAKFIFPNDTSSPQICETTWQNASTCLAEAFPNAVVQKSWDDINKRINHGPYISWQNAVVVDPGDEGYHTFMLEQLARHIIYEDAFMGYIIDRSDWMDITSLQRDDGVTFISEAVNATGSGIGASLKVSYQQMVSDLRAVLDAGPTAQQILQKRLFEKVNDYSSNTSDQIILDTQDTLGTMNGSGLMMMNIYGNGRLDQYKSYDGIFSEGPLVSGAGLLGIMSPTILWTYDSNECCRSANWSDFYFQRHLLMNVMPMIPFPGNDHAISFNVNSAQYYVRYGAMLSAVAPSIWALYPHIISIVNQTGLTTYAKVNAFIAPLDINATNVALLVPVMLGELANGTVLLNLTNIDRVWTSGIKQHPLVKKKRQDIHGSGFYTVDNISTTTTTTTTTWSYIFEALWPGGSNEWLQIGEPVINTDSMIIQVTLIDGAVLVRGRRV